MTKQEIQEARQEQKYWRRVAKLVGATLCGWNGYEDASFTDPCLEIQGHVADVLISQAKIIDDYRIGSKDNQVKDFPHDEQGWQPN